MKQAPGFTCTWTIRRKPVYFNICYISPRSM